MPQSYEEIRGKALDLASDSRSIPIDAPHDPSIARLFWTRQFGQNGDFDRAILQRAAKAKRDLFQGEVFPIVPLYVTSICRERCLYCNYRAANTGLKIDRVRLTDEQLLAEAKFLIDRGYRTIELVYASDPKMQADVICRHAELVGNLLARHGGGLVGVNAEPFDSADYRRLRDAGVTFSLVWMETYDRDRYRELHPGKTPKTNFDYRFDCYARMLDAGIENVGIGVLSGLADWRLDWTTMMYHEAALRSQFGRGAAILGIPRLKKAVGAEVQSTAFVPTDQEFRLALAIHDLFSPETLPFVSTREEWDLCVSLANGGGCLFTFDCSTIPGGYRLGAKGDQFPTRSFDPLISAELLEEKGLHANFRWHFPAPVGV